MEKSKLNKQKLVMDNIISFISPQIYAKNFDENKRETT